MASRFDKYVNAPVAQPATENRFAKYTQQQPQAQLQQAFEEKKGMDRGGNYAKAGGFASTIPFGERITAGIGSAIAAPFVDESLSSLYKQARLDQQTTAEANPTDALIGTGLGIAATLPALSGKALFGTTAATTGIRGGANAIPQALAKVGDFVGRGSSVASRALRGAAVSAPTGALYGYGASTSDLGSDEALGDAAVGAGLAATIGGALPVAGAAIKGGIKEVRSLMKATPEGSAALRSAANPFYKKFTESGGAYSNKLTNEIADLADNLKSQGIAGSTKAADDALNTSLDFYSSLKGKTLKPEDIQKLDQSFADDVARFNKAGEFNFGRILNNLKYEFRDRAFNPEKVGNYVKSGNPEAVQDLIEGNRLWAQSYKAKDVEKILQKSQGVENPQTSIRTGLKNLLANDKKMATYNDAEKALLEDALKRGLTGGAIKLLGGRLTDSVAGGMAGMAAGGPVGAIVGTIAGKGIGGVAADVAGGIQGNRLNRALQEIQGGSKTSRDALQKAFEAKKAAAIGGRVEPTVMAVSRSEPNYAQKLRRNLMAEDAAPAQSRGALAPKAQQANFEMPLIAKLKRSGGVRVGSVLAKELNHMGINAKSIPGLFRKNGRLRDVDRFPADEMQGYGLKVGEEADNGYVNRNTILDAISDEYGFYKKSAQLGVDDVYLNDLGVAADRFNIKTDGKTIQRLESEVNEAIDYEAWLAENLDVNDSLEAAAAKAKKLEQQWLESRGDAWTPDAIQQITLDELEKYTK